MLKKSKQLIIEIVVGCTGRLAWQSHTTQYVVTMVCVGVAGPTTSLPCVTQLHNKPARQLSHAECNYATLLSSLVGRSDSMIRRAIS
jgi:hypothetical protein